MAAGHGDHPVQFYGDDGELAASVAAFLGAGLAAGGSAIIVATAEHRAAFVQALSPGDGGMPGGGRLFMVDAAELLDSFLTGDRLDPAGFQVAVGDLIGQAAATGRPVRVYGEMVALLWDAGRVPLALELEALWNDLGTRVPFALLCAYPARMMAGHDDESDVIEVCRLHTGVVGSYPAGSAADGSPGGEPAEAVRGFTAHLDSAREARHFVLSRLGSRVNQAVAVNAEIVIAELAANAVLHARSAFTVGISHPPDAVRIEVRDRTPLRDGERLVPALGHGLDVVAKVALRWSVEPLPDGKVIWAELPSETRTGGNATW